MLPSSHVILSNLNQPFLPTLSLSATELLGRPEPIPIPTTRGFTAAFPKADTDTEAVAEAHRAAAAAEQPASRSGSTGTGRMPKSMRTETEGLVGRPRDQLENKTGLAVGVITL
jgi:putative membrane protein